MRWSQARSSLLVSSFGGGRSVSATGYVPSSCLGAAVVCWRPIGPVSTVDAAPAAVPDASSVFAVAPLTAVLAAVVGSGAERYVGTAGDLAATMALVGGALVLSRCLRDDADRGWV